MKCTLEISFQKRVSRVSPRQLCFIFWMPVFGRIADKCRAANIDFKEADAFAKLNIARTAWDKGPEHPNAMIAGIWKTLKPATQ